MIFSNSVITTTEENSWDWSEVKLYIYKQQKVEKQLLDLCEQGYRGVGSVGSMGARAPVDFRIALQEPE